MRPVKMFSVQIKINIFQRHGDDNPTFVNKYKKWKLDLCVWHQ